MILETTLQIQSVIYNNNIRALKKAIIGVSNGIKNCKEMGVIITGKLYYGDASPNAILSNDDVIEFNSMLPDSFSFIYKEFGFNTGTAKGHNLMAKDAECKYIMIMNPDIILAPNCLFELFSLVEDPQIGMVEARQTPLEHAKEYNIKTGETEWASTACALFPKKIFDEVDGFDADTFFMYCDDLDFSWRIRKKGYKIIYNPRAIVYHSKKLSLNGGWMPTQAEIYYSAEAAILLAYKWSNFERVKKIIKQYETIGIEFEKKAVMEFKKRQKENKLPTPIDCEHKTARFINDDYCKTRF